MRQERTKCASETCHDRRAIDAAVSGHALPGSVRANPDHSETGFQIMRIRLRRYGPPRTAHRRNRYGHRAVPVTLPGPKVMACFGDARGSGGHGGRCRRCGCRAAHGIRRRGHRLSPAHLVLVRAPAVPQPLRRHHLEERQVRPTQGNSCGPASTWSPVNALPHAGVQSYDKRAAARHVLCIRKEVLAMFVNRQTPPGVAL